MNKLEIIDPFNRRKYNPALDGLRGFAVIAVVAFHAVPSIFPGGWIGVDIFFVLSGYLITGLLKDELERFGRIDLRRFYVRRAFRLTPAFAVLLLFMVVTTVLFSVNMKERLGTVIVSGLYLMNWVKAFDLYSQGNLGHTWSLAMEEQYYIFWPLILPYIYRKRPFQCILALILIITFWRMSLAFSGADPERTYNGFDTHADALLIGCILPFLTISTATVDLFMRLILTPVLFMSLLVFTLDYHTVAAQTIGLSFVSLLSAWMVLGASRSKYFKIICSLRPLVYTGRISYGWYLWHFPILQLGKQKLPQSDIANIAYVAIAYLIAVCSYKWIEKPFLRLKENFNTSSAGSLSKYKEHHRLSNEDN